MSRLNAIELKCQEVLNLINTMMLPGQPKVSQYNHMEIHAHVRDCLVLLRNKEYGCSSGQHSGFCSCKAGAPSHSMPYQKGPI